MGMVGGDAEREQGTRDTDGGDMGTLLVGVAQLFHEHKTLLMLL